MYFELRVVGEACKVILCLLEFKLQLSAWVECMSNQLTQLGELELVELVVTDYCTSERTSELNHI